MRFASLGIFADEESDGESERPGFGRKAGSSFRQAGFSGGGGVAFVSAGVQQPANKPENEGEKEKEEEATADIPVTDSSRFVINDSQ